MRGLLEFRFGGGLSNFGIGPHLGGGLELLLGRDIDRFQQLKEHKHCVF
jgi:hypothetical protein